MPTDQDAVRLSIATMPPEHCVRRNGAATSIASDGGSMLRIDRIGTASAVWRKHAMVENQVSARWPSPPK